MLKLNILITKGTLLHDSAAPRLLNHQASKSVKGSDLYTCFRKNREVTKRCISPICPEEATEWIGTKFGVWGRPADLIT